MSKRTEIQNWISHLPYLSKVMPCYLCYYLASYGSVSCLPEWDRWVLLDWLHQLSGCLACSSFPLLDVSHNSRTSCFGVLQGAAFIAVFGSPWCHLMARSENGKCASFPPHTHKYIYLWLLYHAWTTKELCFLLAEISLVSSHVSGPNSSWCWEQICLTFLREKQ